MKFNKVSYELNDDIALITLNNPDALNALDLELLEDLRSGIKKAASDARCTILTGQGRGFCAGASLSGTEMDGGASFDAGAVLDSHYHPMLELIRNHPHPFLTAINGPAAGAGCSLALMGDMIIASETSYFLQAFRRIGLVPDAGSTYLLARTIGRVRAMEMALLGEKLPASRALEWGLINQVVPAEDLMPIVLDLASKMASGPPLALAATRKLIWDAQEIDYYEALQKERLVQGDLGRTKDFQEGVHAFRNKRPAEFKGH